MQDTTPQRAIQFQTFQNCPQQKNTLPKQGNNSLKTIKEDSKYSEIKAKESYNQNKKHREKPLELPSDSIILNPPISKQPEVVLKYLSKKTKLDLNGLNTIKKWSIEYNSDDLEQNLLFNELSSRNTKPISLHKLEKVKTTTIL